MIIIRYHYKKQQDREMKCTDIFLSRNAYEAWYEVYKDKIKNVAIQGL